MTEGETCPLCFDGRRYSATVSVVESRPFPFPAISRGRIQRMGCSRKCAHATKARMGNKKNGRTWGEISVNVQLSGQPKRRKRSARVWRTVQAHGSGARMWPCVRTVAPVQEWGKYEGRDAGYSADGMRRLERATVPKGQTATNQQRVVGLRKKLRLSNVIRAFKSYLCCLGKLSQQTSTKLCYRAE